LVVSAVEWVSVMSIMAVYLVVSVDSGMDSVVVSVIAVVAKDIMAGVITVVIEAEGIVEVVIKAEDIEEVVIIVTTVNVAVDLGGAAGLRTSSSKKKQNVCF